MPGRRILDRMRVWWFYPLGVALCQGCFPHGGSCSGSGPSIVAEGALPERVGVDASVDFDAVGGDQDDVSWRVESYDPEVDDSLTSTGTTDPTGGSSTGATDTTDGAEPAIEGLPPGMSLDADTGVLSGAPSAPGLYRFNIEASVSSSSCAIHPSGISVTLNIAP